MPEDISKAPDVASASSCMSTSVRIPKLSCMWYMQMLHTAEHCETLTIIYAWKEMQGLVWRQDTNMSIE